MSGLKMRRARVVEMARNWGGPLGAVARPRARVKKGVEDLLAWAYLSELPKLKTSCATMGPEEAKSAWLGVERWLSELSLAGPARENHFGVVVDWGAQGEPHADAIAIHETVLALDEMALGMPEDWSPIAELGELGGHAAGLPRRALETLCAPAEDGEWRLRKPVSRLVFKHAVLGGCPDWRIDPPEVRIVSDYGRPKWFLRKIVWEDGPTGEVAREIEVDGCDKWRHPLPNAYQKTFLDPDPLDGVIGRGEYEIWRFALDVLANALDVRLVDFEPAPSDRAQRPWVEAGPRRGRLLRDLTARGEAVAKKRAAGKKRPLKNA